MKILFLIPIFLILLPISQIFADISENNSSLFDEAVSLHDNGDDQGALEKIRQYLIEYPDDHKAKSNECAYLLKLKQRSEAESCLEQVLSSHPSDSVAITNLGYLYATRGDHESAKTQFSIAHNLDPDNITIHANLLATRVMLGDSSEEILKEHEELLDKSENSVQILVNIAKILNDNKNFDDAKIFLDRAYALDKTHVNTLTQLGIFYGLQNDYFNAEKYLLSGYTENPEDIGILKNLGKLYSDLGDKTNDIQFYKKSIEFYESALKIEPTNEEVKKGLDHSYGKLYDLLNFQLGIFISLGLSAGIGVLMSYYFRYRRLLSLQKKDSEYETKEQRIKDIIFHRIVIIFLTGFLLIPIILFVVSFRYGIQIIVGHDVSNWAAMTVEVVIGVTVASIILSYELSKQDKLDSQQKKISDIIADIKKIEIKQDRRETEKGDIENRFYKLDLLANIESLLTPIHTALLKKYSLEKGMISEEDFGKIIKLQLNDYGYWSDRITNINSNTYVPPDVRNTVRMFLHQAIKPISFSNVAFVEDFLEKTVFDYVNRILNSDYVKNDSDSDVTILCNRVIHSMNSIEELRKRFNSTFGS